MITFDLDLLIIEILYFPLQISKQNHQLASIPTHLDQARKERKLRNQAGFQEHNFKKMVMQMRLPQ